MNTFDRVLCQHGLQYMPDRTAALREMKRVSASAGRLGLSVFSQSIGYQIFERTAAKFVGEKAAAIMREPFALNDLDELSRFVKDCRIIDRADSHEDTPGVFYCGR